jgi:hypothetical protein
MPAHSVLSLDVRARYPRAVLRIGVESEDGQGYSEEGSPCGLRGRTAGDGTIRPHSFSKAQLEERGGPHGRGHIEVLLQQGGKKSGRVFTDRGAHGPDQVNPSCASDLSSDFYPARNPSRNAARNRAASWGTASKQGQHPARLTSLALTGQLPGRRDGALICGFPCAGSNWPNRQFCCVQDQRHLEVGLDDGYIYSQSSLFTPRIQFLHLDTLLSLQGSISSSLQVELISSQLHRPTQWRPPPTMKMGMALPSQPPI